MENEAEKPLFRIDVLDGSRHVYAMQCYSLPDGTRMQNYSMVRYRGKDKKTRVAYISHNHTYVVIEL